LGIVNGEQVRFEKMEKKLTHILVLLVLGIAFNFESADASQSSDAVEISALIINDFGNLKRSVQPIKEDRAFRDKYNLLAGEVNDLIDSIVIFIKKGRMTKNDEHRLENEIRSVNEKISVMNTEREIKLNKQNILNPKPMASALAPLALAVIGGITMVATTVLDVLKLVNEYAVKEYFIEKIKSKKWDII